MDAAKGDGTRISVLRYTTTAYNHQCRIQLYMAIHTPFLSPAQKTREDY